MQPTKEEALQHELTHIPFRTWCPHCVRGKCRNPPHKKIPQGRKEERAIPTVSMDYMFMDGKSPTLVVMAEQTQRILAQVVPKKGVYDLYIAKKVAEIIDSTGYGRVVLKLDGEPAIIEVQELAGREGGAD